MSETNNITGSASAPVDAVQDTAQPKVPATSNPAEEAFAKKERMIRQQQKALQAERAKWQAEQAAKDNEYKTNYVPKSRLTEDPMGVLSEAGITMEKLSELLLNQPNQNDPTVKALRAEMKALKDAQDQQRKWAEEQQNTQYEQAKKQISNEAKMLIDGDAEFETIKAEGLYDTVTDLIVETFESEGRLMDVREACLEVENYLIEQGLKFASYGKVKSRLTPKAEQTPAPAPTKQSAPTVQQVKTLTNQMQTTPSKKSSDAEKRARAIAAFTGKLSG